MLRTAFFLAPLLFVAGASSPGADVEKKAQPREALKPFNGLIGKWNAAGVPEGSAEQRQNGHWSEVLEWGWRFKGDDAWLTVNFDKGKYYKSGELRALSKENEFQLKVETTDKRTLVFVGVFKDRNLTLERIDEKTRDTERLVFALLHDNRITYRYEVKPADKTLFIKLYRVGATKDGEPFASVGFNEKECVVSGGQGTIAVSFKGKTYYVCCSGCRDAFNETPEKYVVEFEKKRAQFNQKESGKK
jgi:YHS domain-containing protein